MAKIKIIQLDNETIFPVTHIDAIYDDDGNKLSDILKDGIQDEKDMTQNDISNNVLTLTTDKYQECKMLDGTEIVLPTLDIYEEIHLFFSTTSDITIVMPNGLKYQQIPSILANKTYEFIFTYTNTSKGWVFGYIEYEG